MRRYFLSLLAVGALAGCASAASVITGYVQTAPNGVQPGNPNVTTITAGQITDTGLAAGCCQVAAGGQLMSTGLGCGSGGGGGGGGGSIGGTINNASQYSASYYSYTGSSNVISGLTAGTSGQILTTQGSAGPPYWTTPPYYDVRSTGSILGFTDSVIGTQNTWLGQFSFINNTSGYQNTAMGASALGNNTIGDQNTGVGQYALSSNQDGIQNSAFGWSALQGSNHASNNNAFGQEALYNDSSGQDNNAFGVGACQSNTIGNKNNCFGYNADVGANNLSNATAIGANATVNASNTMQLGGTGSNAVNVIVSTLTTQGEICFANGSCQTISGILNQNTLQSGAMFFSSSGTVQGPLYVTPNTGSYGYMSLLPGSFVAAPAIVGSGNLSLEWSGGTYGATFAGNTLNGIQAPSAQFPGMNVTVGSLGFKQTTGIPGLNYISFIASQTVTPTQFVLPPADGTAGQFLTTDGQHNLSFTTASSGLLNSTQTWTGANNWTSPTTSTFTYGVAAGSFNVTGSGAGQWNPTEGTAPAGATGVDILYADSTEHGLKEIANNGTAGAVLISTASMTAGHSVYITATHQLADSGSTFNSGGTTPGGANTQIQVNNAGSALTGYSFLTATSTGIVIATQTVISGITQFSLSSAVYATFGGSTTLNAFTQINSSLAVTTSQSPYEAVFSTTAGTYSIDITTTGHLNTPYTVISASVTACGTGPSLLGSDIAGTITTGSGSPTVCTLTFGRPYKNTPVCLCGSNGATACDPTTLSNAAVTFTLGVTETSIKYICIGSD